MLANFYGVSVEYLITGAEDKPHPEAAQPLAAAVVPSDMIDAIAEIVCQEGTLQKARTVSETLGCTCADALALVIRQALKK